MDRLPKNELCLLQKRAGQIKEKPKGGPLEEQIFQKSSQINSRIGLKFHKNILEIKTSLNIYLGPCKPVHAPCTFCSVGGQRARSAQRVAWAKINF